MLAENQEKALGIEKFYQKKTWEKKILLRNTVIC